MPRRRGPEGETAKMDGERREFERGTKHTTKEDGSDEATLKSLIKWSTPSSGECGERIRI